jgi:uncharacterized membrane protein YvbJ
MQCRQCGAEIADKALICYRCGTATTEAKFKAPLPPSRPSWLMMAASTAALAVLLILAVFLGRVQVGQVPHSTTWILVAFAVAIVVLRAIARRSGR